MGVMHFTGLGRSPGAVTAGLSYLKNMQDRDFLDGKIIESVVIFTSNEIISGDLQAYPGVIHNKYMERGSIRNNWAEGMRNSLDIVSKYLYQEIGDEDFYVCEVNVNNLDACFEAVAKALLKFHPPGVTGKHIWANITGGTNLLNAAIMQTAYLSGFIPYLYYTFVANMQEDGKYLQPFSREKHDFDFRELYVLKTVFDERYKSILVELELLDKENQGVWIIDKNLLDRLKGKCISGFEELSVKTFRRDYLNTMLGVERKGNRVDGQKYENRLSEEGKRILSILRMPLFAALTRQNEFRPEEIAKLTMDLNIRRLER